MFGKYRHIRAVSIELELFVPLKLLYLLNVGISNSSSFP